MKTKNRHTWDVEPLEGRALLTGVAPSDVMMVQTLASANNLEAFVDQLALLQGPYAGAAATEQVMLNHTRDLDLALHSVADENGIPLPADVMGADQTAAQGVVAALGTTNFPAAYLDAAFQGQVHVIGDLQLMASGASDPNLQAAAAAALPAAQADLGSIVALGSGTVTAPTSLPAGPVSATLNSSDVQTLTQDSSTTVMEHFLAQLTALQTRNGNVQQYAEKLMSDHEQEAVQLGNYAQATGTYVPAGITQPQDLQETDQVLRSVNRGNYDRVYLETMVRSHTQDIQSNQQTIATTQNPVLKQFSVDDIPTDFLHRLGAAVLLRNRGR
jgi:predicted outer membrane protein